jgi:hypothetical protein
LNTPEQGKSALERLTASPGGSVAMQTPALNLPVLEQPRPDGRSLPASAANVPRPNFDLSAGTAADKSTQPFNPAAPISATAAAPVNPLLNASIGWPQASTIRTADIAKPAPAPTTGTGLLAGFGSSGASTGQPMVATPPASVASTPKAPALNSGPWDQKMAELGNFNANPTNTASFSGPPPPSPFPRPSASPKPVAEDDIDPVKGLPRKKLAVNR